MNAFCKRSGNVTHKKELKFFISFMIYQWGKHLTLSHTAWPPSLPLKSGSKSPWPRNSCILPTCKTSITGQCQSLPPAWAASWSLWTVTPMASEWLCGWTQENTSLGSPVCAVLPQILSSQGKLFKWIYHLTPCILWWVRSIPERASRQVSYCSSAKY
jgi:hypothetical protein